MVGMRRGRREVRVGFGMSDSCGAWTGVEGVEWSGRGRCDGRWDGGCGKAYCR
jgi:hypothetical protein